MKDAHGRRLTLQRDEIVDSRIAKANNFLAGAGSTFEEWS